VSGNTAQALEMYAAPTPSILDEAREYLHSIHNGDNRASLYQRIRDLVAIAKCIHDCDDADEGSCQNRSEVLEAVLEMSEKIQTMILREDDSGIFTTLRLSSIMSYKSYMISRSVDAKTQTVPSIGYLHPCTPFRRSPEGPQRVLEGLSLWGPGEWAKDPQEGPFVGEGTMPMYHIGLPTIGIVGTLEVALS